ncbi:MAG: hypothetical protein KA409_10750 [Ferruginibacter sp.]|nr:hypothetical protein [Ferruginibacter sp.]
MKNLFAKLLLVLACIFFVFFLLEFMPLKGKQYKTRLNESFDPALLQLDSKQKITRYCDSILSDRQSAIPGLDKDSLFTDIASLTIRNRFYHDNAEYGIGNNFVALFLQPFFRDKEVTPIVDVDDLLKLPAAICGQQSRVLASVLRNHNIPVRKVLFDHPSFGGHYALEVFYGGRWHFFDVDKEPELEWLQQADRPSVTTLQSHPEYLAKMYKKDDPKVMADLFSTAITKNLEEVEGRNLLLFQRVTKFLSYTLWAVFLLVYFLVEHPARIKTVNVIRKLYPYRWKFATVRA